MLKNIIILGRFWYLLGKSSESAFDFTKEKNFEVILTKIKTLEIETSFVDLLGLTKIKALEIQTSFVDLLGLTCSNTAMEFHV